MVSIMESNDEQFSDLPVTPSGTTHPTPAADSLTQADPVTPADPRQQLRELERAEAAPYVDYPPTPWWNYPAVGFWAAAYTGTFAWWTLADGNPIVVCAVMIGLSALVGAYLGWYQRYHGAPPSLRGRKPREIRRAYAQYFVGVLALVGLIVLAGWLLGAVAATVTAFLGAMGGFWIYEQAYGRAAAATKARLA